MLISLEGYSLPNVFLCVCFGWVLYLGYSRMRRSDMRRKTMKKKR